jgi:small-conductance mechanosensitive channel/CRP-like cAMP-binding protein
MAMSPTSILALATDPLFLAGVVIVGGFFGARVWRERNSRIHFLIQLLVFVVLTGLMLSGGVIPYRPAAVIADPLKRLLVAALELVWWLAGAWLAAGFMRAFIVLSRRPRESKLGQDLLAALIYLAAAFAIVAYVFDLPVKGLLATSGALAIIIGLALQSSLGDLFSGIVLDIARPYRVGDWIVLDGTTQGKVIETNWRATHILTGAQDVAIVPNSVIAKSKVVNCSSPTEIHGASLRVKLEPVLTPAAGCNLLGEVLLGSVHILRTPPPGVTVVDVSAEMIEFELSYSVAEIGVVDRARNELFNRIHRATAAAGVRFAPRLAGALPQSVGDDGHQAVPDRLIAGISLFSSLTADEKVELASQMERKAYRAGDVVAATGTVLQALTIVSYGVLAGSTEEEGEMIEVIRLAPGDFFGELGVLAGEPLHGEIVALTRAVTYEIPQSALTPLLKARAGLVAELSESLANRRLAKRTVLDSRDRLAPHVPAGLADRLAASIRRVFLLH